jgi:flagellar hook assembly protein FlgD
MLLLNYQNFAVVGYKIKDAVLGLQQSNEIVRDFVLNQNYPNPFNPVTNISFTLRNAERVKITLFNSVGEKIKTIVDGHYTAGDHEFVYDASGLASGVYFYQLEAADHKDTKKMMLVK